MNILENEPLCCHTSLRTGGPARFFTDVATVDDLRAVRDFAAGRALPVFVLGGGSNVLAADEGFDGVVVRIASHGLRVTATSGAAVEVIAEAGEEWDALVAFAVEQGLQGLENLSLIPGRVGAAIVGNIGAYGSEIKDTLAWAETFDLHTGTTRRWEAPECAFGYRTSFFKAEGGRRFVVLRAGFTLRREAPPAIRYRDVQEFFVAQGITTPTLAEARAAVMAVRRRKLPDPARVGTAGSFFKNPVVSRAQYEALAARFPGLPGYEEGPGWVKVPLGWILDRVCGLRGVRRGRVGTHSEQALVIVNDGGTAAEVEAFARELAEAVQARTALEIEWEVEKLARSR